MEFKKFILTSHMELIANKSFLVKKDAKSLNDLKKKMGLALKKNSYYYMYFS